DARKGASPGWEACVPIRPNGPILGLIALASFRTMIPDHDVTLLAVVAAQVAVALQNARYATQLASAQAAVAELRTRLESESLVLQVEPQCAAQCKEIVHGGPALRRVLCLIEKVARTTASILICGETGTGKELIARAVHQLSPRCAGPLVSVNCPAIPPTLAESELFGHERGAFTDAVEARSGKFERADGGAIFLDELS